MFVVAILESLMNRYQNDTHVCMKYLMTLKSNPEYEYILNYKTNI